MADILPPIHAADFLLVESRERGDVLSNLKLQKLLYYAQAWRLALKDQPLFAEDFQAWVHGPVLPSQYHRFKEFTWHPIEKDIIRPSLSTDLEDHLKEIVDVFGSETGVSLELMTHSERPWIEARAGVPLEQPSSATISKDTMKRYYRSLSK